MKEGKLTSSRPGLDLDSGFIKISVLNPPCALATVADKTEGTDTVPLVQCQAQSVHPAHEFFLFPSLPHCKDEEVHYSTIVNLLVNLMVSEVRPLKSRRAGLDRIHRLGRKVPTAHHLVFDLLSRPPGLT